MKIMQGWGQLCLLTNDVENLVSFKTGEIQKIFPFYAVLKYSSVSQSHTPIFFCLCKFFFPISGILCQPLKLQIVVKHFPIPPPLYFLLATGHCFTYGFYKAGLLFFFFSSHLSVRPFLCSPISKYNFTHPSMDRGRR